MLASLALAGRSPGTAYSFNASTRLPTPETELSLCAGISGNGGQVRGNGGQEHENTKTRKSQCYFVLSLAQTWIIELNGLIRARSAL